MAVSPIVLYPANVSAADPTGYPYGKAQDVTAPAAGDGTPFVANLHNDIFGFQQALLSEVSAIPSGTPDKVGASQYLDAILTLIARGAGATVHKTVGSTRTSTTSLTADSELDGVLALDANSFYSYRAYLRFDFSNLGASGVRFNVGGPAGASRRIDSVGIATVGNVSVFDQSSNQTVIWPFADTGNAVLSVTQSGVIQTAGTAGTLGFTWAQETSDANATELSAGSFIQVAKLG